MNKHFEKFIALGVIKNGGNYEIWPFFALFLSMQNFITSDVISRNPSELAER